MPVRLVDRTVSDLLASFAAPDPTPGGGSAAALGGAVGASLLAMVARLPKTRTNSEEERQHLDRAAADLTEWLRALADAVDADTAAYDAVVAAFRLPKSSDAEKAARTAAVQSALARATEVPLHVMRTALRALELAPTVARCGNRNAGSDIGTGVELLVASVGGAAFNVRTNAGSLADAQQSAAFLAEAADIERRAATLRSATRDLLPV